MKRAVKMKTSEEYIEELRRNGVMLVKPDGSLMEIPSGLLELAMKECSSFPHARSVVYEIVDPQDSEHTELKVWDCGFVE